MTDNTKLDDIKIPEGLEARLLSKIDQWAMAEKHQRECLSMNHSHYDHSRRFGRYASFAAILAVIIIAASVTFKPENSALTDTYHDSELAYRETVNALSMLSETLSMGKDKIEAIDLFDAASDSIASSTIISE